MTPLPKPERKISFPACRPPGAKPLRGGDGECWRVWLDAYLGPKELATLAAILGAEVSLTVTIEVNE